LKTYRYEIWDGKQVLSHFESSRMLADEILNFKEFKIPVGTRILKNDGVDILVRFVLDVSQMKADELDLFLRKI
jgi:hypothetical protein